MSLHERTDVRGHLAVYRHAAGESHLAVMGCWPAIDLFTFDFYSFYAHRLGCASLMDGRGPSISEFPLPFSGGFAEAKGPPQGRRSR